jgi:hypothetical protein
MRDLVKPPSLATQLLCRQAATGSALHPLPRELPFITMATEHRMVATAASRRAAGHPGRPQGLITGTFVQWLSLCEIAR